MRVFNRKSKTPQISRSQALKCIPVKNTRITEHRSSEGPIIIQYPMVARPWVARLARHLGGSQDQTRMKKLQLDELGTEVWNLIDGRRDVHRIIEAFAQSHRLQLREAEVSVTQFIRELGKRGVIGLQ